MNLDAVLAPAAPASTVFSDVRTGLRTGQVRSQAFKVASSQIALRIVLAYTDFPAPALVNNLNLLVRSPSGRRYAGNQAGANPATLDTSNNVEVVHVEQPEVGSWTIEVVGSNVPNGPQDFALVRIGHFA